MRSGKRNAKIPFDEPTLRNYVLGCCSLEETERIDSAILSGEIDEILDVIEDELVEDFITGELGDTERRLFAERLLPLDKVRDKIQTYLLLSKTSLLDPILQKQASDSLFGKMLEKLFPRSPQIGDLVSDMRFATSKTKKKAKKKH